MKDEQLPQLGLFICRCLVEGKVEIQKQQSVWCRYSQYLPVCSNDFSVQFAPFSFPHMPTQILRCLHETKEGYES